MLTAKKVSSLISRKSISISDYLSALINQIEKAEQRVNAWQYIDYELAYSYVIQLENKFNAKT